MDFFNEENERRLRLKKRKVLIDMGVIKTKKESIKSLRGDEEKGKNVVAPSMILLLKGYLEKRSLAEIRD